MPRKSDKEILLFLTNVGQPPIDGDPNFVEKAKEIMKLITEKKIFMRPKDEVGIMLMGQTENDLDNKTRFITLFQEKQVPSWEMVEKIMNIKESKESFTDWTKALLEALELLTEYQTDSRIILIMLFDCDTVCGDLDSDEIRGVIDKLTELENQFLWIGSKSLKDCPDTKLNENEKVLMKIVNAINGEYMTLEKTLPTLRIFKRPETRVMPWKCPLIMGDIAIPTVSYIQAVDDDKAPVLKTIETKIEDGLEMKTVVKAERDFVDRRREVHSPTETIPAYIYGRKAIPIVPEVDGVSMTAPSNEKSFEICEFVSIDSVDLEHFGGESVRIVLPDGPIAEKAFFCFLMAMANQDLVAIARRIYKDGSEVKMCMLIPKFNEPDEPTCFILVDLLFLEDQRIIKCPSLKSIRKKITEKQESAIEDLIDDLMLPDIEEIDEDLFAPGTVPSPGLQHLWNSLSHRALNPDAPLPPANEDLLKLLEPPESIKSQSEKVLNKLREIFPLENTDDETKVDQTKDTEGETVRNDNVVKDITEENKWIPAPQEPVVDLDELFDADMDI